MITSFIDPYLNVALKELDLRGFSFAEVPKESRLRIKGDYMVIYNNKILAYVNSAQEAVDMAREFLAAKNKLKGART